MKKTLLKFFKDDELFQEIIRRMDFSTESEVESAGAWQSAFYRTPELSDWMKRREILLLKTLTLGEHPPQFIMGQIFENRCWQRFDIPRAATPKVDLKTEKKKVLPKTDFLKSWNKDGAKTNQESGSTKEPV